MELKKGLVIKLENELGHKMYLCAEQVEMVVKEWYLNGMYPEILFEEGTVCELDEILEDSNYEGFKVETIK